MFIERPLATLPADHAERFVRAMFAPAQRLARAYHHHFRMQGHNEPTVRLETCVELHVAADRLLGNLADPDLHTIGTQQVAASWQDAGSAAAYQPIGLFGYRTLTDDHALGAQIARRWTGQLGLAHGVSILDEHQGLDVLETIFLSIARKAARAGHDQLFLVTPDHRLRRLYERFGMEFPDELQLPARTHLIGRFELAANRASIHALERSLAASSPFAWAA